MTDLAKQRVNYNKIAHLYDEPVRDREIDPNLLEFLRARPDLSLDKLHLLDTGCGTGKQLAANRAHLPEPYMIGLDLFDGMLHQAKRRADRVDWINGSNIAPPFRNESFHYITNQFSYHHVPDKPRLLTELHRLLKPDGRLVVTNIDPWTMPSWLVYGYFPASFKLDSQDCLPVEQFVALMKRIGFTNVKFRRDYYARVEELHEIQAYLSERYRMSQLMAISDADYQAGLQRISDDLERLGGEHILVRSELCFVTISGNK